MDTYLIVTIALTSSVILLLFLKKVRKIGDNNSYLFNFILTLIATFIGVYIGLYYSNLNREKLNTEEIQSQLVLAMKDIENNYNSHLNTTLEGGLFIPFQSKNEKYLLFEPKLAISIISKSQVKSELSDEANIMLENLIQDLNFIENKTAQNFLNSSKEELNFKKDGVRLYLMKLLLIREILYCEINLRKTYFTDIELETWYKELHYSIWAGVPNKSFVENIITRNKSISESINRKINALDLEEKSYIYLIQNIKKDSTFSGAQHIDTYESKHNNQHVN